MLLIDDSDFLNLGFVYGSSNESLRIAKVDTSYFYLIQAWRDEGPQWKLRFYMAAREDNIEWSLVDSRVVEDYSKLLKLLGSAWEVVGSDITRNIT